MNDDTTKTSRRPSRITGLQAAQVGLVRQLEGWREQLGGEEYAGLIDLHSRWLAHERARIAQTHQRRRTAA